MKLTIHKKAQVDRVVNNHTTCPADLARYCRLAFWRGGNAANRLNYEGRKYWAYVSAWNYLVQWNAHTL